MATSDKQEQQGRRIEPDPERAEGTFTAHFERGHAAEALIVQNALTDGLIKCLPGILWAPVRT